MKKWLIDMLETNPEVLFGLLTIGTIIFLILISLLATRSAKVYYENVTSKKIKEVEKNILKQFSGYENKILQTIDNIKKQIDFKQTKILLLNDIDDKVTRIFNLCGMRNIDYDLDIENIHEYSSIVIYLQNESDINQLQSQVKQISDDVIKIIYYEGFIKDKNLLPENHVLVNFEYTLIEKLHSVYLVKKIMEK